MARVVDPQALADGVLADRRADLARAITLVESSRADHRAAAQEMLLTLTPNAGKSFRVGITGVPGVGKSTTIEALGMRLIELGHKVAVLAVDPSSTRTGGSILGDKTRMGRLAVHPNAYIRPSPTSGTLGGVAKATRESIVLVEAAGFDVVLVETVGVGQSEVAVANMVDTFTFLTLARTGDSLQGIKKGVLELADVVVVNKADGKHQLEARSAARELRSALSLIYPHDAFWHPPVLTMSALENDGVNEYWDAVLAHRQAMVDDGRFDSHRSSQEVGWMWAMVHDILLSRLGQSADVGSVRSGVEAAVASGELTPTLAAQEILNAFDKR
ncbi:methylmalonyl Co-A mutase-associated GTPase MeaB [Gordonia sp. CPCC 205333]|uniref:methylmalonyl Co-A mutase-associated GTPase MeaB n=1 Tax=Gordonia sp. CPCC 205333 TaxID=3140790 RepID=UPI003AF3A27C